MNFIQQLALHFHIPAGKIHFSVTVCLMLKGIGAK